MDAEIDMNFSEPVADLGYLNVEGLELDEQIPIVNALVVSGNPLKDYSFVQHFPNQVLFHADNTNLTEFKQLAPLSTIKNMQYLILRNNLIQDFQNFPQMEQLLHLDLSCNPLQQQLNLTYKMSMLQKFYFGVPAPPTVYQERMSCYSRTRLNTFTAFKRLFLNRFYNDQDIVFARDSRAIINQLGFKFTEQNQDIYVKIQKTENEAIIKNWKTIISLYSVITGCEIIEVNQKVIHIYDIVKAKAPLCGPADFSPAAFSYPTEKQQDGEMSKRLQELRATQLQQGSNYNIITIECQGKIVVYCMDKTSFQQVNFALEAQALQKYIDTLDKSQTLRQTADQKMSTNDNGERGYMNAPQKSFQTYGSIADIDVLDASSPNTPRGHIKVPDFGSKLMKASSIARSGSLASTTNVGIIGKLYVHNEILIQPAQDIIEITYFSTVKPKDQLLLEVEALLKSQNQLSQDSDVEQILLNSFSRFSNSNVEILKERRDYFVYVNLVLPNNNGVILPLKISLSKHRDASPLEKFQIRKALTDRFLVVLLKYNGYDRCVFSEDAVEYFPSISKVELLASFNKKKQDDMLVVKLYETVAGREEVCVYDKVSYSYYRNGVLITETNDFYLKNVVDTSFEPHGMFKVVVHIHDGSGNIVSEFSSSEVYVKYAGKKGKQSSSEDSSSDSSTEDSEIDLKDQMKKQMLSVKANASSSHLVKTQKRGDSEDEESSETRRKKEKKAKKNKQKEPTPEPEPEAEPDNGCNLPVQHKIESYSDNLQKPYELRVISPYTEAKPTISVYQQLFTKTYNVNHKEQMLTGLLPSTAAFTVDQDGDSFYVTINFAVTDIGKMMWLLVDFGDFNQMIPLSYTPIYDDEEADVKVPVDADCVYVNPFQGVIEEVILEASEKAVTLKNLDGNVIATCHPKECLPIVITKDVRIPFSSFLMDQDMASMNYLLRNAFRGLMNFEDDDSLFTIEAEQQIQKFDKKKFVEISNGSTTLALIMQGVGYLVQFEVVEHLIKTIIPLQDKCQLLFNIDYTDNDLEELVQINYDIDHIRYMNIDDYHDFMNEIEVTVSDCNFLSGEQLTIDIYHPDQEFQKYLTFFSNLVSIGQNKIITNSLVENNAFTLSRKLTDMDAGYELMVNFNGFSKKISRTFVQFSNPSIRDELLDQVTRGILDTSCKATYLGDTIDVKIIHKKGKISLTSKSFKQKLECDDINFGCVPFGKYCAVTFGGFGIALYKGDYSLDFSFYCANKAGDNYF